MNEVALSTELDRAKEIGQSITLPSEVREIRLESGKDYGGGPALWINIVLAPGAVAKRSEIKKITDFGSNLQTRSLHDGLTAFPYFKLEAAA